MKKGYQAPLFEQRDYVQENTIGNEKSYPEDNETSFKEMNAG